MRPSTFTIIALAGLIATAGTAWAGQATEAVHEGSVQEDLDQIVCKAGKPPVGSHLPGPRICKSKRDWQAEAKDAQDYVDFMQKKGTTSCFQAIGCGG